MIYELTASLRDDERLDLDAPIETIRSKIASNAPVIVRGFLRAEEAALIREVCGDWARREPDSNPEVTLSTPNYHRIDDDPPKSQVKGRLHKYVFFYWNADTDLVAAPFRRCFRLRNLLSGLDEDCALLDSRDGLVSMPIVQQYPRGGGYLEEHRDPDVGQKVVVNVVLSEFGADYAEGGVFYRDAAKTKHHIDPQLKPGDAFLFNPQIAHGVDPIDPATPLDWSRIDGRWMMMSTLVTLTSLNGIDDGSSGRSV